MNEEQYKQVLANLTEASSLLREIQKEINQLRVSVDKGFNAVNYEMHMSNKYPKH